jgi:protein-tyrosine phosphatase
VPRATRKTFTLREFARLAAGITSADLPPAADSIADSLRQLVEVVASRRGMVPPPESPDEDDIIDPYQRSEAIYQQSAQEMVPAVDGVVAAFRLAASRVS